MEFLINEDMHKIIMPFYKEQSPVLVDNDSYHGHLRWAMPQHYVTEAESACLTKLWSRVLNIFPVVPYQV